MAVVPFGARARDARAGAIGRQLARRLVDRFAGSDALDLRPVFLVAIGETKADAGFLVFGSTPDATLAASYGRSLGTTHALTGLYLDDGETRSLSLTLVDVGKGAATVEHVVSIAPGALQDAERRVAEWLGDALDVPVPSVDPPAANELAYIGLLEGLDEEVNATLLRAGDPSGELAARSRAFDAFGASLRADPDATLAEDQLLVLAAESVERNDEARAVRALEDATLARPRSWRAHYLLGQLRVAIGEGSAAVVALEHANALRPLRDADLVSLAELYLAADAPGQAASHLRRVDPSTVAYVRAQELLGLLALGKGDAAVARTHLERAAERGSASARVSLARVSITQGDLAEARREIDTVLGLGASADVVAQARRLRLGLERPDLEVDLERAGRAALTVDGSALDEARAAFERVIAFDGAIWEAHFGLGLVARKRDDHAAAASAFRRVLELAPEQPDALHELGVAVLASGEENEAVSLLERAATLRPGDAAYLADAGFAHLRSGDLATARERLRLATSIDSEDALTRTYLEELERAEAASAKRN